MIDFTKLDYLKAGNIKQKRAYEILTKYRIFEKLTYYSPILAGTIPIEIDIEGSDLDIICNVKNENEFLEVLNQILPQNIDFTIVTNIINNENCIILNCILEDFPIEIFGQNKPTTEQNAYRHMVVEHNILDEKGEEFKQKIIELKKQGIKTEPAFGLLLNLENPYEDLLKF
ncbi:DUF4269 domain-containing protein [Chryseobacterium polytrichastri]|uniref:DUF4269 domain-containing protein n=1 Tax=Chryseobacterium polytrichastri TaxID=1302687 RepID=A0A1M7GQM5_9FLAO|nr:DUF4269 domain-containing protein [Chryseobacterium polytrichastri]SHM18603.1 protein of unknown function [Chryseobacterium polytrichastri]